MQVVSDQVGNCDSGWWGDSVIVGGEVTVRGVSDFEVSLTTYYLSDHNRRFGNLFNLYMVYFAPISIL